MIMKQVEVYTDGACSGNPGPGGWGAVLRYGVAEKELAGYQPETTNNRMELTAAIQGLEAGRKTAGKRAIKSRCSTWTFGRRWTFSWPGTKWRSIG